jgi:hypothetical protein
MIQKKHEVHYSCFTSICDLFTDSPLHLQAKMHAAYEYYIKILLYFIS